MRTATQELGSHSAKNGSLDTQLQADFTLPLPHFPTVPTLKILGGEFVVGEERLDSGQSKPKLATIGLKPAHTMSGMLRPSLSTAACYNSHIVYRSNALQLFKTLGLQLCEIRGSYQTILQL